MTVVVTRITSKGAMQVLANVQGLTFKARDEARQVSTWSVEPARLIQSQQSARHEGSCAGGCKAGLFLYACYDLQSTRSIKQAQRLGSVALV